jgi:hypothetical protein
MGAIDLAAQAGCLRLSLAAAPVTGFHDCPPILAQVTQRLGYQSGAGLAQFKQAFAPRWEARYLIAPGRLSLLESLAVIVTEIHRNHSISLLHDDEEYRIAPANGTCDIPEILVPEILIHEVEDDAVECPVKAA